MKQHVILNEQKREITWRRELVNERLFNVYVTNVEIVDFNGRKVFFVEVNDSFNFLYDGESYVKVFYEGITPQGDPQWSVLHNELLTIAEKEAIDAWTAENIR